MVKARMPVLHAAFALACLFDELAGMLFQQ
jgi:hypothetical protein